MDEAQVPMRTHLAVIQKLQEHDKKHKEQIIRWGTIAKAHLNEVQMHKETKKEYERIIDGLQKEIDQHHENLKHVLSTKQGEKGLDGMPGRDGQNGMDADEQVITAKLLNVLPSLIPEPISGKDAEVDEEALIKSLLKRIKKEKTLDLSDIKGVQKFIKDGISYKIEELMHGGGGSAGSIFSVQVPTGTVNGVNNTFVFKTAPSVIVLDNGNFMNRVSSDGTVNWTISGTTVTLNQVPLFNIYGF